MTFTFSYSGVGLKSQDVRSRDTPRGETVCAGELKGKSKEITLQCLSQQWTEQ